MANKTAWRDTYKPPRLGPLDARAAFVILPALMHIRIWTISIAVLVLVSLWYIEQRRQLSVSAAVRMIRCWLVTKLSSADRPARPLHKVGYAIDYGRD